MKSKYISNVKPKLEVIRAWCRDGLIDKEISDKLKVSLSAFNVYKRTYPELKEVLSEGKEEADIKVENSLNKRALGYMQELIKGIKCKEINYDPTTGKKLSEIEVIRYATEYIHVQADVTAIIFWLKNRQPDKWRDRKVIDANLTTIKLEDIVCSVQQED